MEWVSMLEQLHHYITKHNAKHGLQWHKANHHWTQCNGDVFTGVMTFDIYQDLLIKSILVSAVSLVL